MRGHARAHTHRHQIRLLSVVSIVLVLSVASVAGQQQTVEERARPALSLHYTTAVMDGAFDHYRVRIEVRHRAEPATRFVLPKWAPGAYRITQWYTGISDVEAEDLEGGSLEVRHTEDSEWEVVNGSTSDFVFSYSVAAPTRRNDQGVPMLNNRHYLYDQGGLIDGPRTWMYVSGAKETRVITHFELPGEWRVATGLNPTPDPFVFSAESYDWLIDSPTMVGAQGNLHLWRFISWGVPFTIAYDAAGQEIGFDTEAFVASVKRVCDYQASVFGGFPFAHYTFLYDNGGGGGLEHLRSTTIGGAAGRLETDPNALWNITAHEFFHTWNVKRLRPYVLGPFDYQRPNRTQNLWLSEGVTDTYTAFTGIRAGFFTPEEFYEAIGHSIASWMGNPAQPYAAPARMSWTSWDSRQRNPNGTVSYYTQGEVLGVALDLIIREATGNERSLDDVMRILMKEHGGEFVEKPGFRTEDVIRICSEVAGRDLYDFFEAYVLGTARPDWATYFSYAGLDYAEEEIEVPDLGFFASNTPEGPVIRFVNEQSAAYKAGLRAGDRVLSVDGKEAATSGRLAGAVQQKGVGGRVRLVVQRGSEQQTIRWRIKPRRVLQVSITERAEATPEQLAVRRGLLTGATGR